MSTMTTIVRPHKYERFYMYNNDRENTYFVGYFTRQYKIQRVYLVENIYIHFGCKILRLKYFLNISIKKDLNIKVIKL